MTTIFDVKNMSYEVNGKKILKDISFTVEKGEFLTIKGPSGSGKSTLLECLASLISPSSGEIYYKGKPLSAFDVTDYRKEVSYGFQNASLFGETVAENLAFPYLIRDQEFDRKRALELLKKVNLSESYLEQKVTALSGGEKQRIALIRNVVFMPEVLLLDEVTSSLDEATRHDIGEAIRRFNQEEGVTVLWVTHNTEEIKNATKTMEIVAGQVEVDTHA
ncbi:putative iron export ATP-binding protein FetA [Jeotgalibaca dankookensis]|uniref:Putative iron export ATP-binding protein FetA n=1 Tax=Jeotgalibaca dankookensis TaxID=708126 RepID=A0A1S6IPH4_9LACT|nr:putative iron export ATP-binding protein FetA [Jeotgalibaca dankookensis]